MGDFRDSYQLTSADEALAMLDAFVAGERRVLQLRDELASAGEDAMAWDRRRLRSLMAEQQRRYQALEAWWAIAPAHQRRAIDAEPSLGAVPFGYQPVTRLARWLQQSILMRRRPCPES